MTPLPPKAIAARVDAWRQLSPRVALLGIAAPELSDRPFTPGDKIKLASPGGPPKSYTPARYDAAAARLEVVVHLHGQGPTARWAATEPVGDQVALLGPVRSLRQTPTPTDQALFYGDETALGLARALADALPDGLALDGVIELAPDDLPAAEALGLSIGRPRHTPGEAALAHAAAVPLENDVRVWLSGRAETVKALHALFRDRGLDRSQVVAKPYWSERGTKARKAIAKSVA